MGVCGGRQRQANKRRHTVWMYVTHIKCVARLYALYMYSQSGYVRRKKKNLYQNEALFSVDCCVPRAFLLMCVLFETKKWKKAALTFCCVSLSRIVKQLTSFNGTRASHLSTCAFSVRSNGQKNATFVQTSWKNDKNVCTLIQL